MKSKTLKLTVTFLCVCAVIFCSLSAITYGFDPQNVYRWNEHGVRYYNETYSAAGAVKYYDYDTVFIGSSLFQNLDAERIAGLYGCKPLKLTAGAMIPEELLYLYKQVQQTGKVNSYVLNIDLHRLASSAEVRPDCGRFPDYMFNAGGISQLKYLLGYETWFRFIPVDFVMSAARALHISLPQSFENLLDSATDINTMSEWENENAPGKDAVLTEYRAGYRGFNEGDSLDYVDDPLKNAEDLMLNILDGMDENDTVTIVLPPCSSLYWADKNAEEFDALTAMRGRIAEIADEHSNIKLLDFQATEQTTNLDFYYDQVHFNKELQMLIEDALMSDEYLADTVRVNANSEIIRQNAAIMQAEAADF